MPCARANSRHDAVRGRFVFLAVVLAAVCLPARAALPTSAATPLTELAGQNLPVVSKLATELKKQFDNVTESSGTYTLANATVSGLKGTYVLFKPAGATNFMLAALFSDLPLDNLGQSSFFEGITPKTTLLIFSAQSLGSSPVATSAWPSSLLALDPKPDTLLVGSGLNIYMPLKGLSKDSDVARFLDDVKLSLNSLRAEVRIPKGKTLSATLVTTTDWSEPFGLRGTKLSNMGLQLGISKASGTTKRNMQAWGDFELANKTYSLWGSQTKSSGTSPPTRAFGLAASSVAMEDLMKFVDAIPVIGDYGLGATVNDNLPTDKINVSNAAYRKPSAGSLPSASSYMLLYAEPGETVANTGRRGPLFYTNGAVELLGWKAASLTANMDPKRGTFTGSGRIDSPPTGSLPLSAGATMAVDVNKGQRKYAINLSGSARIEDLTIAGAMFSVSKTRVAGSVDMGCVPPMLKGTVDAAIGGAIPAPSIGASDCAERTKTAIADAAQKAGHTLSDAARWVGDGLKGLVGSLKGETTTITNASIPLWGTAARHMMVSNMIADMTAKGVTSTKFTPALELPAAFGMGNILSRAVTVTKAQLESDLVNVTCKADGRLSYLYKFKNSFVGNVTAEAIRASGGDPDKETTFYDPFKARAAEIKKIVDKVKADGGPASAVMKDYANYQKYLSLAICENKAAA